MITKIKELSYRERLVDMNFPTMEERKKRGDMITTFKFLSQTDSVESEQLFEIS